MPVIQFPYGKETLSIDIPQERLSAVLTSEMHHYKPELSQEELVREALEHPIGTPKLSVMAEGKKKVVIIASDHTRPVPSKIIMPQMLAEIRKGNPDADITILISTGCHRETTKEELVNKFGPDIVAQEKIVIHDCDDPTQVSLGKLPSGGELIVDRLAVEADLLVAEGFIEPHFFAGFSGGRKSVLPGVCDQVTVLGNHCAKFIASDCARTGVLEGNPLHIDMVDAARQAKLAYIVNVIIDEDKKVVAAFAGNYVKAHETGCAFLKGYCRVKPQKRGDVVITSNGGAPLDQNMYQSVKGLTAAESAAAPGAVLIICSRCNDGTGGEGFYRALKDCESPEKLQEETLKIPMEQTNPDQWEYQILVRMMCKHHIIFVSDPSARQFVEDMKLEYAPDLETALDRAYALKGKDAHTVVIPNGISVIVEE